MNVYFFLDNSGNESKPHSIQEFRRCITYLESEKIEADIIPLSPDVNEFTEEEFFDDEDLGEPVLSDVGDTLEIYIPTDDNEDRRVISLVSMKQDEDNNNRNSIRCKQYDLVNRKRPKTSFAACWKKQSLLGKLGK